MANYFEVNFINIGNLILSIVAFSYILIIVLNLRTQNKNKEAILFFVFLALIVSDIVINTIVKNAQNLNEKILVNSLLSIIITSCFFIISIIDYNKPIQKFSKIAKTQTGVIIFIASFFCVILFYILKSYNLISNNVYNIGLLTYFFVSLLTFLTIYIHFYSKYSGNIGFTIKTALCFYLLTYFLILINLLLVLSYEPFTNSVISPELYALKPLADIVLKSLKTAIYLLLALFGVIKILVTENEFINQYLDFTKSKKGEFKTLDIIENLILKSEEFDSTLENILDIACELTNSDGGIIYVYDKDLEEFIGRKINGYVVPPFFIHDKILEDSKEVYKKIYSKRITNTSLFFNTVKNNEEMVLIQREGNEDSRKPLSQLRDYADNIGSLMAGKIVIDDELFGIIILQELYANYSLSDINIFKAICSFSGVLIKNLRSKSMEKERERLKNEMKIAEQIQTGILPRQYDLDGYNIAALMKPAEEVGGDYYDIQVAEDGSYWANIGDVTGHGVTAGLIMMMLQTCSASTIKSIPDISPKDLTVLCNKVIFENIQNRLLLDQFITACFLKFNKEGVFEYSGAHEDILILRNATNHVETLKTKGIWLGLMEDISHGTTLNRFNLYKGDTLLLFTDGVIEIKNEESEQYDTKRLKQFFQKHGKATPEEFSKLLIDDLEKFKDIQKDDITFIIIRKE